MVFVLGCLFGFGDQLFELFPIDLPVLLDRGLLQLNQNVSQLFRELRAQAQPVRV